MNIKDKNNAVREASESSLSNFIRLVAPQRVLGHVHVELCDWWTRSTAKNHQMVLLPRDHQKSAMMAYRVAWTITKNPCSTFLYISSTSSLAEKQLYFIKNILTSSIYRRYWPEMIHKDEGKRSKWTNTEIIVDHPDRTRAGIRDSTIKVAGLTTQITGLHFTHAVLDDVVVKDNAYTAEGRKQVESQYSLLASVESTGTDENSSGAEEWVVGTRYHPSDLYNTLLTMKEDEFDRDGEIIGTRDVYEIFERKVENEGDGSGEFLWPRQRNKDGRWYGFNREILAKKRAKYLDKSQYRCQYYNDPNNGDEDAIHSSKFQYYERSLLKNDQGEWSIRDRQLRLYAAMDFAFSLRKQADYTAIVVIGIDYDSNIYVLDIDRFRTGKVEEYFKHLLDLLTKWNFRKLRAEITGGQQVIVNELKTNYLHKQGIPLAIDEYRPSRVEGSKQERISAILGHRYEEQKMWHYKGGNCQILEDELSVLFPPHDDVKDALASACSIAKPPMKKLTLVRNTNNTPLSKFGGVG